jgi:hypothetical protein
MTALGSLAGAALTNSSIFTPQFSVGVIAWLQQIFSKPLPCAYFLRISRLIVTPCVFLVFCCLVACFSDLMDVNRFGACTFFVVIADATGMGLFAFLTELSSGESEVMHNNEFTIRVSTCPPVAVRHSCTQTISHRLAKGSSRV